MIFLVLTLLAAGTIATHGDKKIDREPKLPFRRWNYKDRCTTTESSTPATSTLSPETTTSDPCDECRNDPLSITDTWAGQCFANGEGSSCNCVCGDVFCFDGEVIDRSTCISGGRLQDCKCIATATTAPTTVPPTQDHFIGCEWCLNSKLSVGDTFAGHCFPNTSQGECYCLCADVFCKEGEIIDRTTCVEGGSINNCKCIVIDSHASTTTSTSMPLDS